ncbi:NUDIX domain-containing protein [Aureimonas sp. N4]|uniref:NUDIX domain-containing protein n=1 Tax=Aureimonas sp. N4 TaxID=1638165 RepID=UPI0007838E67|nr:NUDIX domain-containing protein [Aureimonas sp. N4]
MAGRRKRIKTKVIGLAFQDGRLLAFEVTDDLGRLRGVRPLGGSIEYGETREDALAREFREELDTRIEITGDWTVFESLYEKDGETRHEFLFAAPIRLLDCDIPTDGGVIYPEGDGTLCTARWFEIEALARGEPRLFPGALLPFLMNHPFG